MRICNLWHDSGEDYKVGLTGELEDVGKADLSPIRLHKMSKDELHYKYLDYLMVDLKYLYHRFSVDYDHEVFYGDDNNLSSKALFFCGNNLALIDDLRESIYSYLMDLEYLNFKVDHLVKRANLRIKDAVYIYLSARNKPVKDTDLLAGIKDIKKAKEELNNLDSLDS